jgi:PTH1 family peptidyl-tRNA hydrolase
MSIRSLPVSAIPGAITSSTRHNLGWVVLDALAAKHGLAWKPAPQFEAQVARWDVGPVTCLVGQAAHVHERKRPFDRCLARFLQDRPGGIVVAVYDDLTSTSG